MKNLKFLWVLLLAVAFKWTAGQNVSSLSTSTLPAEGFSGWQLSVRGGYDFPLYDFGNRFVDYKGGLEAGASVDYYWSWLGVGVDFDYIQNKPENTFPATGIKGPYRYELTRFELLEKKITRMFYGIGPDFRFLQTPAGGFEVKLRAGLSVVKGGETRLTGRADTAQAAGPILLNYHGGFDKDKKVFAAKGSVQYNYFFSRNVGFHLGAYYLYHSKAADLKSATEGMAMGYVNLSENNQVVSVDDMTRRVDATQDNMQSFGGFAGLTFRFNKKARIIPPVVIPEPPEAVTCMITVTARDKYTGEVLPGANVTLSNTSGILRTATTDGAGQVIFDRVPEGGYTIAGDYEGKQLEEALVASSAFGDCAATGGIKKEVLLNDPNFMVMGKVVNCDSNVVIPNAAVIVKNNTTGAVKTYATDGQGEFAFVAAPGTGYTVYARKANYLSQNVSFTTASYDRKKSKYIQLQICVESAGCNDAVVLKNILYDLDKSFIREDAKPELNRLVQFMKDNPEVRVELSSHTDSRGSDAYNMKLSQRRAQAAVDYIISQGIARARLIAKGYGESKLVNGCKNGVPCSEADHQLNRRTEMKVVCPDRQ